MTITWLSLSWAALAALSGCEDPKPTECPLLVQRVKTIRKTLGLIAVAAPKEGATVQDIERYVNASANAFDQAATTTNRLSLQRPDLIEHKNEIAELSTQAATDARKIAAGLSEMGATRTDLGQLEKTAIDKLGDAKGGAPSFLEKCPEKLESCQAVSKAVEGLEKGLPAATDAETGAKRADALALRFDELQGFVKAATDVPEDVRKPFANAAGDAASAFRALATALHEVAPIYSQIMKAQRETEAALLRLNAALDAAAGACGEKLPVVPSSSAALPAPSTAAPTSLPSPAANPPSP